jgi:hypothetical protein
MLPTTPIIFPSCCQQRRKMIGVVAYNADNFSALWTTAQKNDWRCFLHSGKVFGIVANNAEKCLNLNISTNLKSYAKLH